MGRYEAKTSRKGQATIPVEVRNLIGLEPGGSLQFIVSPEGQVSVVAKKSGLRHLKGLFGPQVAPVDVEAAISDTIGRRTDPQSGGIDP